MTKRITLLTAFILLLVPATLSEAFRGKLIETIVKVVTGGAAAESMRRSAHSFDQYETERSILERLQEQGLDCSNDAIYSIYFKTDGGYWADFWSKPDVFFYVDIEGLGSFLVPQIHNNYSGQHILDRILAKEVPPGSKVVVRVMDDDTTSDVVWNNILSTRVNIDVSSDLRVTQFIPVRSGASGTIRLLDRQVTIDAPDYIAECVFEVPLTINGIWMADGQLQDEDGNSVGAIQMASVWAARRDFDEQANLASSWRSSGVFWLVIGVCCFLWFLKSVFIPNKK